MRETPGPLGDKPSKVRARAQGPSAPPAWDEAADPRIIFDLALNAIITMDTAGLVTGWNPAAVAMFGWSAAEAIGQPVADLVVPPRFRELHIAGLHHYLETNEGPVLNSIVEMVGLRRDGSEFPVELSISPAWADSAGRITFLAFIRDISSHRAAIIEETRLRELAESAQRETNTVIDMIVHELRSPLTVVAGYADLISGFSDLPDAARQPLAMVSAKAQELEGLVAALLTASRLGSGNVQPELSVADLSQLGNDACERLLDAARLRNATVVVDIHGGAAIPVYCDPQYTALILSNVVGNALRYGGEGPRVTITVDCDPDLGVGRVAVSDHGSGIAEDQRERIFERFARGQEHTHEPGTGLGLYVARMLAEQQGGSLELLASCANQGSTFTLCLPLANADLALS